MGHQEIQFETEVQTTDQTPKPGDTMEKDGKTYVLNHNHRWEFSDEEKRLSHLAHSAKQEDRRDRLESAAGNARREAEGRYKTAHKIGERFYMGQPIIMNHHSTRGSLRARERMDQNMRASIEAQENAKELDYKAGGIGNAGISSDDASAIDQLRAKLADLEKKQEMLKKINAAYAQFKKDPASLDKSDLKERTKENIRDFEPQWRGSKPFESCTLANNSSNMRRIKQRIEELEKESHRRATMDNSDREQGWILEGHPVTVTEDHDENRIFIDFNGKKLTSENFNKFKSHGFRWMHSKAVFSRQLNDSARYWSKDILQGIGAVIVVSEY